MSRNLLRSLVRSAAARRTLLVLGLLLVALPFLGCGAEHSEESAGWHCPMHPTYTSDKPGDCPICGMKLVPIPKGESAASKVEATPGERPVLFYRSPMDPSVTSPVPAKDVMGMDYLPVYADEASRPASSVSGLATVETTASGIEIAGVRTAVAKVERLGRPTRTVGLVLPDERRVRHVHTKISGWVETLHVNFTGQLVRRGQPILAIYSPELLASQEEYLRARRSAERFAQSNIPEVREGGEELVASARRRLELFDVPRDFLATLDRTGEAQRAVTLVAPAAGFVTSKQVLEGMEVQPGMELFTLTDLSHVWVEAEFYEGEARLIELGQQASIHLPYEPGHAMTGQVTFIYPTLSPESRTLKVRLEFDNPDGHLKPGMFVDVTSDLQTAEGVSVPEDAVIDSGLRQVIFVESAPGTFEPREVQVGLRGNGRAVILSGVAEGERVATRANFLLDSESRLRAALAASQATAPSAPTPAPSDAAPGADGGHQH